MLKFASFFLPILMATQFALADIADDMKGAEKLYKAGKYSQAEQNYQNVINKADPNKPEDLELVFKARRKLPLIYLAMDQQPQAQAAVQQLLAKNHDHERLPHAIHEIVELAKKIDRTLQAGQVYQNILAVQPKHPQAIWLKMGIAIANAHLNNDEAVDSTLQNIITQHANDDRAAEALGQTAWAYRKLKQDAKARNVYQYVVDNWPNKDRAIYSQRGLVLCSIALDDQVAADAGVQKILADYAGSKYMPKIMRNIAVAYDSKDKPDEAAMLHQYVVDKHPESLEALWSQRDITLYHIDAGEEQAVEADLQKLVAGFTDHAQLPEALGNVGEYYRKKGKFLNARQLHQHVVTQFPTSTEAIQSQRNAILSSVGLNDEPQIEVGIQKLLTQFAEDKDIAAVVYYVAVRIGDSRDDDQLRLCQYIIDQHPEHELVVPAKARLGQIMIHRDNEKDAEAVFQKILTDYQNHLQLAEAFHLMAEGYWDRAFMEPRQDRQMTDKAKESLQKAFAKWEGMITQFPNASRVEQAHYLIGECCYRLGQYEKAIEYYQKTVDNFPDYENAWLAQNRVAKVYKFMLMDGMIPRHEAETLVKAVYEKLIDNYPDCPAAKTANKWLGLYARSTEGEEK